MNLYATVDEYSAEKAHKTAVASLSAAQVTAILKRLNRASRRVDTWCMRHFYPLTDTFYFDFLNTWEIRFDEKDLLAATTITTANGDTTLTSSDYDLRTGDVHNLLPYSRLVMRDDTANILTYSDRRQQANAVTGVWGYHEDYSNAFLDSLDTVENNPLTAAGTSLTVNDADGADSEGMSPRFSVGQMIQIEDEWCYVSAINVSTNVLTIARGQNGSTAAEHVQNTTISVYKPMPEIVEATLLIASFLERLPQAPFGIIQTLEKTQPMRVQIPASAEQILEPFQRVLVGYYQSGRHDDGRTGRLFPWGRDPWKGDYGI